MKLTFITNSCMLIELKSGTTILCDPWLRDGIYEGSWGNYPELKQRDRWLNLKPDYIYISHIHPDHCDPETLKYFPKDTIIIIAKMRHGHLRDKISNIGFTNVWEYSTDCEHQLFKQRDVDEYPIAPSPVGNFVIHPSFIPTGKGQVDLVDYEIDTALSVFDSDGTTLFNCNDNPIRPESAQKLLDDFYPERPPDIALLPCSGAGLYPQCMQNIEIKDKLYSKAETELTSIRNFTNVNTVLAAPITVPLSGQYKLIGKHAYLDKYIRRVTPAHFHAEPITWLNEGDTVEIDGPVDMEGMMNDAYQNFIIKFAKINPNRSYDVGINNTHYTLEYKDADAYKINFTMDPYMLIKIMQGRISWNEAEIGSHIMVSREPDVYDKTIHSLMNYYRV